MKTAKNKKRIDRRHTDPANSNPMDGGVIKDRRKSYYAGKYNREVYSLLLLVAIVAYYIVGQVA